MIIQVVHLLTRYVRVIFYSHLEMLNQFVTSCIMVDIFRYIRHSTAQQFHNTHMYLQGREEI
jgi:hypothetical protein